MRLTTLQLYAAAIARKREIALRNPHPTGGLFHPEARGLQAVSLRFRRVDCIPNVGYSLRFGNGGRVTHRSPPESTSPRGWGAR